MIWVICMCECGFSGSALSFADYCNFNIRLWTIFLYLSDQRNNNKRKDRDNFIKTMTKWKLRFLKLKKSCWSVLEIFIAIDLALKIGILFSTCNSFAECSANTIENVKLLSHSVRMHLLLHIPIQISFLVIFIDADTVLYEQILVQSWVKH